MVMISSFENCASITNANRISLVFIIKMPKPGILPSKPVEYSVRTLNMFFTNCCVMVEAPRAR